jgi:hypothetical protein
MWARTKWRVHGMDDGMDDLGGAPAPTRLRQHYHSPCITPEAGRSVRRLKDAGVCSSRIEAKLFFWSGIWFAELQKWANSDSGVF